VPRAVAAGQVFPAGVEFDDLKNETVFTVESKMIATPKSQTWNVYQTDPFQKWLVARYNSDYRTNIVRGSLFSRMDLRYKDGWRQLEGLYKNVLDTIAEIQKNADAPGMLCRSERRFIDSVNGVLDGNIIVLGLRNNPFMRHWLWLTSGLLTFNPLQATTDDKLYPAGEGYLIRDSLKKPPPPVPSLAQVRQATRLFNKIILPQSEKKPVYVLHYDYRAEWKKRHDFVVDSIKTIATEGQIYVICAHNVPQDANVQYVYVKSALPASKILQQLSNGADGLGTLLSVLTPLTSFWTANVNPLVTPAPVLPGQGNIPGVGVGVGPGGHFGERVVSVKAKTVRQQAADSVARARQQYADSVAKADVLKSFVACTCKGDTLIWNFLHRDNCVTFPAKSDPNYAAAVTSLLARYQQFQVNLSRIQANQLVKDILQAQCIGALQGLMKMADRSLPPDADTMKVDTVDGPPLYHTEAGRPPSSGLTQVNFTLNNVNQTKAGKDSSFQVFNGTLVVRKKSLFKLSVGFGWTLSDYNKNVVTSTNNQIAVTNDNARAKLIAGLNIYPWGLLEPDDKFLGISRDSQRRGTEWHRISFFVGVGIPEPLQNYYGGLGYDIIPGIKLQGGVHLIYYTKNEVSNNLVIAQSNGVQKAGYFASLNLDVSFVAKLLGVSK